MGKFVEFKDIATSGGAGQRDVGAAGVLALIDIIPVESASFTITISRVLPDGTLVTIYTAAGITADTTLGRTDFTPNSIELAGLVRVAFASAGDHADPAHVYLTVV